MNITELKALAEKATPGPWGHEEIDPTDPEWGACEVFTAASDDQSDDHVATHVCKVKDAAYIAAVNPAAILGLIAQLEDAKNAAKTWENEADRRSERYVKAAVALEDAQSENRALLATEQNLRGCLAELVEAADSMRGTYTFQQGKTPEDEDHYGHEAWAGEFLNEQADAARALLEKQK